jgi:hypothetical protein
MERREAAKPMRDERARGRETAQAGGGLEPSAEDAAQALPEPAPEGWLWTAIMSSWRHSAIRAGRGSRARRSSARPTSRVRAISRVQASH